MVDDDVERRLFARSEFESLDIAATAVYLFIHKPGRMDHAAVRCTYR